MKRAKPADLFARPNQIVQIQNIITIKSHAITDRGAFQYLKRQPKTRQVKLLVGKGKYLGDLNQLTAFVWLNDEPEITVA